MAGNARPTCVLNIINEKLKALFQSGEMSVTRPEFRNSTNGESEEGACHKS